MELAANERCGMAWSAAKRSADGWRWQGLDWLREHIRWSATGLIGPALDWLGQEQLLISDPQMHGKCQHAWLD